MTRLLIVADIRLYREGLAELLRREDGVELVGTAGHLGEALRKIASMKADVVLVDLVMTDGITVGRTIHEAAPDVQLIALAADELEERIVDYAEAGFCGFIHRDGAIDDLIKTVTAVQAGELPCSPKVARHLLSRVASLTTADAAVPDSRHLTNRETEVAGLLKRGLTNKEIARRLHIAVSTVKNHVHRILEKLHARRRAEVAWRLREAWLPPRESPAAVPCDKQQRRARTGHWKPLQSRAEPRT